MTPILGITASSITPFLGDFESIATVTVGSGGAANAEFTSIPSDYQHLQLRYIARSTNALTNEGLIVVQVNSNTGNNYSVHYLLGNGSSASSGNLTSYSGFTYFYDADGAATSSSFGAGIIDFLDYKDTNKNKTVRGLSGGDFNGGGAVGLTSGLYFANTNAITSIKITADSDNLAQYSHFALYGIKG